MRDESGLKAALRKHVKATLPSFIVFAHADASKHGVPDWSITGGGKTSWWEFKHGTPAFSSTGIQELTMNRMAAHGFARYVIWQEDADGTNKRTLIVHPRNFKTLETENWCKGHDHAFVAEFMRGVHS